jgi:hypothetical protein
MADSDKSFNLTKPVAFFDILATGIYTRIPRIFVMLAFKFVNLACEIGQVSPKLVISSGNLSGNLEF